MFEKSLKKSHFTLFLYKQNVSYISDVKIRNATFLVIFKQCASLSGIRHVILFTDNDLFPC